MTQTDNLHLKKPGADDFYNVEDFNENFDAIDKAVTEKAPAAHTHTKSEITDFPESLPANGGNADTLDELHANDFSHSHGNIADCHDATLLGTYNATPETANTPYSGYWIISVDTAGSGSWIRQTAILCNPNSATEIYHCICINGAWNKWTNIADGGNAATANTAGTLSAASSNICLRNLSSGTAEANTTNCPVGAWYGQYEEV